jgi:hypothetical protein
MGDASYLTSVVDVAKMKKESSRQLEPTKFNTATFATTTSAPKEIGQ